MLLSLAPPAARGAPRAAETPERMRAASRALASAPRERAALADAAARAVVSRGLVLEGVAGATTASIVLASLTARRLELPLVYVRPRPKGHGTQKRLEGTLAPGACTLLVQDVLGDPAQVVDALEVVEQHGGRPVACLCLYAEDFEAAARLLGQRGVALVSLSQSAAGDPVSPGASPARPARPLAAEPVAADPQRRSERAIAARLAANRISVAETLLDVGAVTIRPARPFRYVSGLLSPIYPDNRLLISDPHRWRVVIEALLDLLRFQVGLEDPDVLAGTATAGLPHASLLADRLGLPMVYVTLDAADRASGRVEGRLRAGARVVMVEDHVTTGGSVLAAARVLRDGGARVAECVAIFTYLRLERAPGARAPSVELQGLRFYPLCDVFTLLRVAVRRGTIGAAERSAVLEWLRDPEGWSARREREDIGGG